MKITALIPDELVKEVQKLSGGKNITESLIIALQHYVSSKKLYDIIEEIDREPLQFREGFAPYGPRKSNRNR